MNLKIVIDPIRPVTLEIDPPKSSLEELQAIVGGDIQFVPQFNALPLNHLAAFRDMAASFLRHMQKGERDPQALISAWETIVGELASRGFTQEKCVVYCNEDGKSLGLVPNLDANALWALALRCPPQNMPDVLVGPVVILAGDEAFFD